VTQDEMTAVLLVQLVADLPKCLDWLSAGDHRLGGTGSPCFLRLRTYP
jgi:hypothetical protein